MVKRNFEYFLQKLPKKYRSNVRVVSEDMGGSTKVEFKNCVCGCISKTTITAITIRNQFDLCKPCMTTLKNKERGRGTDAYISMIVSKFGEIYSRYIDIINDCKEEGYHQKVKYTHPVCGCSIVISLGELAKRKQLDICSVCFTIKDRRAGIKSTAKQVFDLDYYLKDFPYKSRIELVEEYHGIHSKVKYTYKCGCTTTASIRNIRKRKHLDLCKVHDGWPKKSRKANELKLHYHSLSKDEMIEVLSEHLSDINIVSGFPGNRSTILVGKCRVCGEEFIDTYFNLQQYYSRNKNQCKNCMSPSRQQDFLYDFVKELQQDAIKNDNKTIRFNATDERCKELDIYCPSKKIAIEYNGFYFHSEIYKPDRLYHWKKTKACREAGITLLNIWEDDWRERPDIIKSIIKAKLGVIVNKIYARKTQIKELTKIELKKFFNENHLHGNIGCIAGWGLFYNGKLVQAISVRKVGTQNKRYRGFLEIAREATLLEHIIVGGESKLLNEIYNYAIRNKYIGILNYVSANFGGIISNKWKFSYGGETAVSYFYMKRNCLKRIARQKLQKRDGCSEAEHAKKNGFIRVNDNVNLVYVYRF
jgi:hypothetical protein